jgi:hypothetical protein
MQEKAMVCGNQVGILAFARLGNFSLVAVVRRRRGGKGIRTPGLLIANETLYQLSYTPRLPMKTEPKRAAKNSIYTPIFYTRTDLLSIRSTCFAPAIVHHFFS